MMRNTFSINRYEKGQVLLEFGLVLVLVVAVAVGSLSLFGSGLGGQYQAVVRALGMGHDETAAYVTIMNDFLDRINAFYAENGYWPRSWGTYAFTDIGLDPGDWLGPVEGIRWKPHGPDVGLGTKAGDEYIIYVQDLDGNEMRLYDNWNIWCVAGDSRCYYHVVAPENEIDITTLRLVKRE